MVSSSNLHAIVLDQIEQAQIEVFEVGLASLLFDHIERRVNSVPEFQILLGHTWIRRSGATARRIGGGFDEQRIILENRREARLLKVRVQILQKHQNLTSLAITAIQTAISRS